MPELIGNAVEGTYNGKPIRTFHGKLRLYAGDPRIIAGHALDFPEIDVGVDLAIHPNQSGKIIINVPGLGGSMDGYAEKYKKQAHYLQSSDLGAVIRIDNDYRHGLAPDFDLRFALQYAKEHAWEICGETDPEISLMGLSDGAGIIAAIAHEYPSIKNILLYAPNMLAEVEREGLKKFNGQVTIVVGDQDKEGVEGSRIAYEIAAKASDRKLVIIPNCNHNFTGELNGRIFSHAPFFAFAEGERPRFPDPNKGIKLYD